MTYIYCQEDVQQILQLAIARHSHGGEFSREQLLEIAAELGIPPEELQVAEQEWVLQKQRLQDLQTFSSYRRNKFKHHLSKYLIVNAFLVLLNFITAGSLSWALYFAVIWGLGVSLDGWKTYQMSSEEYQQEFQKWRRKHQISRSINTFLDRLLKPSLT